MLFDKNFYFVFFSIFVLSGVFVATQSGNFVDFFLTILGLSMLSASLIYIGASVVVLIIICSSVSIEE